MKTRILICNDRLSGAVGSRLASGRRWARHFSTVALAGMALGAGSLAQAADGSWNLNGGGNWSDPNNWSPVAVPGGAGSTVNFTNDISANSTVTIDTTSRTVGIMNVGDSTGSQRFQFAGSGGAALIFDSGSADPAQLNFLRNQNSVLATLPIQLGSSLDIRNSTASQQTISGGISSSTAGTKTVTNAGTGSGPTQINGNITNGSGTVALRQNSATSSLVLVGPSTYSGGTTLDLGTLGVEGTGTLGSGILTINGGRFINSGTGSVTVNNAVTWNGNVIMNGTNGGTTSTTRLELSGLISLTGNRSVTVENTPNGLGGGFVRFSGGTADVGGSRSLTKLGVGVLDLSTTVNGAFAHTGGTFIEEGTLRISTSSVTANTFAAGSAITVDGGIFDVATTNKAAEAVGSVTLIDGSIIGSAGSAVLTASSFDLRSGTVSKAIGGSGATLTKSTSGTVTLSGTNSYTGTTTVSDGTLLINGNNSAATGAVTVNGGVLGGSGTIGGAVTIATGGTLSPGNSPGILTVNNSVTINDGGAFSVEINGATVGTEYDRVVMTGGASVFSLSGSNNLELSLGYIPAEDTLFFLVDNQGSSAIAGIFESLNGVVTNLSQDAVFTVSGQQFRISYEGNLGSNAFTGGNDLVIMAIPEVRTPALLALALGFVLFRLRRSSRIVRG